MEKGKLFFIGVGTVMLLLAPISNAAGAVSDDSVYARIAQHTEEIRLLVGKNEAPRLKRQMNSERVLLQVDIVAGGLSAALTPLEKSTVTELVILGSLDARDFKIMRDSIKNLQRVDMRNAVIEAYTGIEGTYGTTTMAYAKNIIPQKAFYMDFLLTSIELPLTTTAIEDEAFCGCQKLTSIALPPSVRVINDLAFYLSGLRSIEISASVDSIGFAALMGLAIVDEGNPVYSSLDGVLFNKEKTVLLYFPTEKSGVYTVPLSVHTIKAFAFHDCRLVTSIALSSNVTDIDAYSFQGCRGLASINIPLSVKTIGNGAFQYCDSLLWLYIPASVEHLGDFALSCNAIIEVDGSNPYFCSENGVLFNKTKSKLIQCPTSRTGTYVIPSSVTEIGSHSFQLCTRIKAIAIPPFVSSIGGMGFYRCSSLHSLYASRPIPIDVTSSYAIFNEINKTTCTLYVPPGSKNAYQTASQWKDFVNIREILSEISLSTTAIAIGAAENSAAPIEIATITDWLVEWDVPWLTVVFPTGSGNGTCTIFAKANMTDSVRTAVFTVSGTDALPKTFTVTQSPNSVGIKEIAGTGNQYNPGVVYRKPFLSFTNSRLGTPVALYSLNGAQVHSTIIGKYTAIDMSMFPPGVYLLKIASPDKCIKTKVFFNE